MCVRVQIKIQKLIKYKLNLVILRDIFSKFKGFLNKLFFLTSFDLVYKMTASSFYGQFVCKNNFFIGQIILSKTYLIFKFFFYLILID